MNETTNKRKERIKTILIIFLALLLVLTFFSNTIQNYSLPIVAAQYAGYGTVTETVRCSGMVTANQNYEVVSDGNRTVSEVKVKAGDKIKEGDVLYVMEGAEGSEAVEMAEQTLQEAELSYQKALLTAAPDYAAQNQEIANAREDLQEAINALNEAKASNNSAVSQSAYLAAMSTVTNLTAKIAELTAYQEAMDAGVYDGLPAEYAGTLPEVTAQMETAKLDYEEAQASYDQAAGGITVSSAEQKATIEALERTASELELAHTRAKEDYEASDDDVTLRRAMEDAKLAWDYAAQDVEKAKNTLTAIETAETELSELQKYYEEVRKNETGEADRGEAE